MGYRRISFDVDQLVADYVAGESALSLAKRFGVTQQTITARLKSRGVEIRTKGWQIVEKNGYRQCRRCLQFKVSSEEFFEAHGSAGGLRTMCRECRKQLFRENDSEKKANEEKRKRELDTNTRVCKRCRNPKTLDAFPKPSSRICKRCQQDQENERWANTKV